jgi:hypothetical protein
MIFQLIVLVIILLLTAYLVTQGWLSATLVFISGASASILAGALYEPLSGPINSYKPDYGHGTTFLMIFFLSFSVLRIASDMLVRGKIKLPVWVDRAGAVVVGLLASLVITGTTVIGVEMLPFPQAIMGSSLGWDPYPDGNRLADDARTPDSKLWLNPDGFVTWIYEMTLGRSMGGAYGGDLTFAQAHPDLREELWGYRHRVQLTSNFTLPNSMMDAPVAWQYSEKDLKDKDLVLANEKAWPADKARYIVRMRVRKGSEFPNVSTDKDLFFRATPSQIRLVAVDNSGNTVQAYPVGFLDKGERFVGWAPAPGKYRTIIGKTGLEPITVPYSLEDYTSGEGAGEQVTVDWAFSLPPDFKPVFLEVKSLARQNVEVATSRPAIAEAQYPPRKHLQETFVCSVQMRDKTTPIKLNKVYIVSSSVKRTVLKSLISEVDQKLDSLRGDASNKPAPGVPSFEEIKRASESSQKVNLNTSDEEVGWIEFLNNAVWAPMSLVSGNSNHSVIGKFLNDRVLPYITDPRVDHTILTTNDAGKTTPDTQLAKGPHTIIAWYLTSDHIYVWYRNFDATPKGHCVFVLTTGSAASPTNELKEFAPDFVWPK